MFLFQSGTGSKSPISIAGDGRGVLCLHGLTGTPFEVRPLAEALGTAGYTVEVPLLAGHGATLRDLAATQLVGLAGVGGARAPGSVPPHG